MDRQYVEWYKVNLENGKLSEAKIKTEAVKFFDLAAEELNKYKKKERRLKFLKTARDEMKCGFKYKDWCSKEFRLFDSPNETLVRKLEQEQENVSQLMKESEGIKLLRERSTGENIFDAERQVFSKNSDGTIKRSVIRETYARVTVRQKRKSVDGDSLEENSESAQIKKAKKMSNILDH